MALYRNIEIHVLALYPRAYGARSHIAPTAVDPLRLLTASLEFPDGDHLPTALDPLRLPPVSSEFPGAQSARPRAQAALANPVTICRV